MAHGKFRAESDPTRTVAQVGAENHNITPVKLINTPAEVIIIQVKRPKQNKKQSQSSQPLKDPLAVAISFYVFQSGVPNVDSCP